jgi:hypothetical protein
MLMAKKTMGVFTSREVRRSHVALASYDYNNGASAIEEVSWLSIWSHGRMRAGRESGWYLGMNFGENHYLLIYGRFNGPAELRERLSTILWYQLQSLRTLAFASGRSDFDLREIREEMETQIISSSKFLSLESLSLAFTLFDRTQKKSLSGHFGPSRPVVLCQNNQVTPENRIIATLANGRDLRYWDVESCLVGPHLYLLTHDSSRFDISPSDTQRRIVMTQISEGASPSVMHQVVESLLPKENIPRYYVGAVLNDEKQSTSDSVLPKAQ